jgi:hypothetical protein
MGGLFFAAGPIMRIPGTHMNKAGVGPRMTREAEKRQRGLPFKGIGAGARQRPRDELISTEEDGTTAA